MNHIGNPSCTFNAMHPTLRCGINPSGPCDRCPDFRKATVGDRISRKLQLPRWGNRKALVRAGLEISVGVAGAIVVGVPLGVFIGFKWVELSGQGQSVHFCNIEKKVAREIAPIQNCKTVEI
jgi:hypothetical protein